MKIKSRIWLVVGSIFLILANIEGLSKYQLLNNSEIVTGEVIGFEVTKDDELYDIYWPVIYFLTKDDYGYEFKSSVASYDLETGDQVSVMYSITAPNNARLLENGATIWIGTFILCIFALFAVLRAFGIKDIKLGRRVDT
jgi:hypothetical protein